MCTWGDTVVLIVHGGPVDVDRCIAPLVELLNANGIDGGTIASCCGHGHRPGRITLASGREIVLCRDYEDASAIDKLFPDIHGDDAHDSHVVPIGCAREHVTSPDCWCDPRRVSQGEGAIWVHNRRAES